MGAPAGHPFFGNQYTDGNYKLGSFTYEVIDKGIDTIKTVISETGKGAASVAIKPKADTLISKTIVTKSSNKNTLIIGGIILGATAIGGFITYKLLKRKAKAKQAHLQSIELQNVGTCVNCGEPLVESTYVPESKEGSHDDYIICKSCGEKNFARYPGESEPTDNNFESQNDEEETK